MRKMIILVFILFSCEQTEKENINSELNIIKPLNYLALGDSYTIGESIDENQRWPIQLTELLNKRDQTFSNPKIIAKTGWATDELLLAINDENIQKKYDLVTLLIGVNDQYRGRGVEEFRIDYRTVLAKAIELANNNPNNVLVVSIPDWGVSPFAIAMDHEKISREINLFNQVKKEETLKKQIRFIDITEISRKALNNKLYIAGDGLHFSGEMYKLWVEEIINKGF